MRTFIIYAVPSYILQQYLFVIPLFSIKLNPFLFSYLSLDNQLIKSAINYFNDIVEAFVRI